MKKQIKTDFLSSLPDDYAAAIAFLSKDDAARILYLVDAVVSGVRDAALNRSVGLGAVGATEILYKIAVKQERGNFDSSWPNSGADPVMASTWAAWRNSVSEVEKIKNDLS